MKKCVFLFLIGLITMSFIACNNSKKPNDYVSNIPGDFVGAVLPWVIDGDEATQGTALLALHEDNGTYYVDFNGEACRIRSISSINFGDTILYYSFNTNWGGTYYLEDITNPANRFYNK